MATIRNRIKKYDETLSDISLTPPFPKTMLLEVSNICNHNCLFCANSKSTRKKGFIDKEFALYILKEAYKLGTREVGFYATGEPLVDRNLESYICYAKKLGFEYVFITTNGALLSKQRAETLINAGIDSIKFSINGADQNDYQLIHGKDDFNAVIENLEYLSKIRKDRGVKLYISFIATRQTIQTREVFEKKYRKYVDDILFINCVNQTGLMPEINEYLSLIEGNGAINTVDGVCPMIFNKLYVSYEGYLTMCCADFQNYLAVADLKKDELKAAWLNKYAQEIRRKHLEKRTQGTLCGNCIYNVHRECAPLVRELADIIDINKYSKAEEIEARLLDWEARK